MKTIKLNESDLQRIVKRVIKETHGVTDMQNREMGTKLAKAKEEYDKEKKKRVNNLLQKINNSIRYSVERNLENIISKETVFFQFNNPKSKQLCMYSDSATNNPIIKFDSDYYGGKFELRGPILFTEIEAKDYVSGVEGELNDEEKSLFEEVGVTVIKDKSIKEVLFEGRIPLYLMRGNNPSMMSWENLNVTGPNSLGEKTACQGIPFFDGLGDKIPADLILNYKSKRQVICNGGTRIGNSGIVLKFTDTPLRDIFKPKK